MKANKAGDVFPLWGTCLGFEFLSICGAGGGNVISNVDGENYSVNLNLSVGKWIYSFLIAPVAKIFAFKNVLKYPPGTKPLVWCTGLCELIVVWFLSFSELLFFFVGYQSSRLFGSAPAEIITFLKTKDVTFNHHRHCVSTDVCLLTIFASPIFLSWWESFHNKTIILILIIWTPVKYQVSFPAETYICSHVKIRCYLHTGRDHRRYDYIKNCAFESKLIWYFTGVCIINRILHIIYNIRSLICKLNCMYKLNCT